MSKRPLMSAAAEQHADQVVLTSDNPRNEDPHSILAQMRMGLAHPERAQIMVDRAQAIAHAVQRAKVQDVVLIAGKGHEDYQDVRGIRHPFSDVAHAKQALQQWRGHV
jgi:UDP-N-acetylmuramoyl-L-alanyl-D-glutamate--2,6-diaminopimelate ligase